MPIYKTLTKKEIGPIIDPELENELDNETLDTHKALPADIAAKPQKLKRSQTYGGKRNTRKNRTRKHRK